MGNDASLRQFYELALRALHKWLNRRSQKRSYTWKHLTELLRHLGVQRPWAGAG